MKKLFLATLLIGSLNTFAQSEIMLNCKPVLGNSVYAKLTLKFKIDMPSLSYDFKIIKNKVTLNGEANPKHDDVLDGDDFSYVTLGDRTATVEKEAYSNNFSFYLETCLDCDFNSAEYKFIHIESDELFLTEEYGSDGSSEFSVYSCKE